MIPHRYHLRAVSACLLLAWAASAAAATLSEDEMELAMAYGDKSSFSLATGSKQTVRRAPAVATVITAEDIAAIGATDLDEVLETVPGMHVSRTGIVNQPIYVMRGIYSNPTNPQILMLQNGVPMTSLYSGDKGNVWGGLPLENIARIEIIRGPGSALYGADAYAGVINIISKTAADVGGTQFGARVGAFDSKDAWVQHGGKLGSLEVAAFLRWGKTDGQKETIERDAQATRDNNPPFFTHASYAPGPQNTAVDSLDATIDLALDKWRLRMGYKGRDNVGTGAGVANSLDPNSHASSQRTNADLSWTDPQIAQDVGVGVTASYLFYDERTDETNLLLNPPGTRIGPSYFPDGMIGGPNRWERSLRLSAFATYSGFKGHNLRVGAGHDDLDLYKTRTYKNFLVAPSGLPVPTGPVQEYSDIQPAISPQQRQNNYLYAQDEWNVMQDWTLTAGVRHDNYSDFGGTTNPRLALVWDTSLDLTTKLLWSKAFRAPAFIEAYGINPVQSGNPDLKPERLSSREIAFNWQARKDTQVNLNLFRYDMDDIIRPVTNATPGTGATWQNTGSQRGTGGELEAVWDHSHALRVTGNYAYQRAVDQTSNQDAGYGPQSHIYLRADWRFASGWQASAQGNRVLNRERAAGDSREPVPDYNSVDLTLRTNLGKHWELAGSVRNLFDARIIEPTLPNTVPTDLPQAGRSWYLQAMYKL
jgi:outer membrane receptor for ferrienterochelin and colicin